VCSKTDGAAAIDRKRSSVRGETNSGGLTEFKVDDLGVPSLTVCLD